MAILSKKVETVKLLLANNADPDIPNQDGEVPIYVTLRYLWYASAEWARNQIINALLDHNVRLDKRPNPNGLTTLRTALKVRLDDTVMERLFKDGAPVMEPRPKCHNRTALHEVSGSDDVRLLKFCVEKGHNIDFNARDDEGFAPVHCAARAGSVNVLKLLRDSKWGNFAAKDYQGWTAMHFCVQTLGLADFNNLFSGEHEVECSGIEGPKEGGVSLPGDTESVVSGPLMQNHGLNVPDIDGSTPLHWAFRHNNNEMVAMLLSLSAGRQRACKRGWTPRYIAQFYGKWYSCASLLSPHKVYVEELDAGAGRSANDTRRDGDNVKDQNDGAPHDVAKGEVHHGVSCDGCGYYGIRGIQFKCEAYYNNFCFKCHWTANKTHWPTHTWRRIGTGPDEGPFSSDRARAVDAQNVDNPKSGTKPLRRRWYPTPYGDSDIDWI